LTDLLISVFFFPSFFFSSEMLSVEESKGISYTVMGMDSII